MFYVECDFYYSGSYVYENDIEGQYSVNFFYWFLVYYGYECQRDYSRFFYEDEVDWVFYNLYVIFWLLRKVVVKLEYIIKNIYKVLVVEYLCGWYQWVIGQKDQGYSLQISFDLDRGLQRCLGFVGL